ncbi:MAG: TetR family transcriptional regulator [Thermoleophilia bacterium]
MARRRDTAPPEAAAPAEAAGRRRRSDGLRSRQAILVAAAELATVEGLDGLSIGRLAEHVGMSKSGLYAHFGSKEELQLATVDTARQIFDREVTDRAATSAEGLPRLRATCEAFLDYLDRGVFPGGCFFVSAAVELDAKEGRVPDHLREVYAELIDDLVRHALKAVELGQLAPTTDVGQLVFELDAMMLCANVATVFFKDRQSLERARAAIDARVGAALA